APRPHPPRAFCPPPGQDTRARMRARVGYANIAWCLAVGISNAPHRPRVHIPLGRGLPWPALVARLHGTADVQAAVRFARERGLEIAVRGGGHNVAGNAVCDGGLMIDLSAMRGVEVHPRGR